MSENPTPVFIESPFAGKHYARNVEYARRAMWDAMLNHNEAPFVSHLLYTQHPSAGIIDDGDDRSIGRELGLRAAAAMRSVVIHVVVYTDYGITPGMARGILHAQHSGIDVVWRTIGQNPAPESKA
jgi:hypothetical protein